MKRIFIFQAALLICLSFVLLGCKKNNHTETQKIIQEAQTMTLEALARKAIEEANGKEFICVGNSSRGKTAIPLFIKYLQSLDPSFTMTYDWGTPKNNKIFDQLTVDYNKRESEISMALVQDGNQIESKLVKTGIVETFIPKAWAEANNLDSKKYPTLLPLQTLNKVFMYNCVDSTITFTNCWDYVLDGKHGEFMNMDSEVVGKNFLCMLTHQTYAKYLKDAYDKLSPSKQAQLQSTISSMDKDAKDMGLDENGKYALAWIKRWVGSYTSVSNDGPILADLVEKDSVGHFGLLVYSKLRLVTETETASKSNVKVAAYNEGYEGIGGYGYCHYLFVTHNSPLPWTACAFIAFLTCTEEGFSSWGQDMGGYSSNPVVAQETDTKYKHLELQGDKGFNWWVNQGKLVLEDPAYCAKVQSTVGSWIEMLDRAA